MPICFKKISIFQTSSETLDISATNSEATVIMLDWKFCISVAVPKFSLRRDASIVEAINACRANIANGTVPYSIISDTNVFRSLQSKVFYIPQIIV